MDKKTGCKINMNSLDMIYLLIKREAELLGRVMCFLHHNTTEYVVGEQDRGII